MTFILMFSGASDPQSPSTAIVKSEAEEMVVAVEMDGGGTETF